MYDRVLFCKDGILMQVRVVWRLSSKDHCSSSKESSSLKQQMASICLFVLGLGLDVSHGAHSLPFCLTIVTAFAEISEVTSSLCESILGA